MSSPEPAAEQALTIIEGNEGGLALADPVMAPVDELRANIELFPAPGPDATTNATGNATANATAGGTAGGSPGTAGLGFVGVETSQTKENVAATATATATATPAAAGGGGGADDGLASLRRSVRPAGVNLAWEPEEEAPMDRLLCVYCLPSTNRIDGDVAATFASPKACLASFLGALGGLVSQNRGVNVDLVLVLDASSASPSTMEFARVSMAKAQALLLALGGGLVQCRIQAVRGAPPGMAANSIAQYHAALQAAELWASGIPSSAQARSNSYLYIASGDMLYTDKDALRATLAPLRQGIAQFSTPYDAVDKYVRTHDAFSPMALLVQGGCEKGTGVYLTRFGHVRRTISTLRTFATTALAFLGTGEGLREAARADPADPLLGWLEVTGGMAQHVLVHCLPTRCTPPTFADMPMIKARQDVPWSAHGQHAGLAAVRLAKKDDAIATSEEQAAAFVDSCF